MRPKLCLARSSRMHTITSGARCRALVNESEAIRGIGCRVADELDFLGHECGLANANDLHRPGIEGGSLQLKRDAMEAKRGRNAAGAKWPQVARFIWLWNTPRLVSVFAFWKGGEAAMETIIPIADLQSIYSIADVDRALGDEAARRNEGLRNWYDRMRGRGISSNRRRRRQLMLSANNRPISSTSSTTCASVWRWRSPATKPYSSRRCCF
jgi:hypothetical protein